MQSPRQPPGAARHLASPRPAVSAPLIGGVAEHCIRPVNDSRRDISDGKQVLDVLPGAISIEWHAGPRCSEAPWRLTDQQDRSRDWPIGRAQHRSRAAETGAGPAGTGLGQ
jgi:hypothetical protein